MSGKKTFFDVFYRNILRELQCHPSLQDGEFDDILIDWGEAFIKGNGRFWHNIELLVGVWVNGVEVGVLTLALSDHTSEISDGSSKHTGEMAFLDLLAGTITSPNTLAMRERLTKLVLSRLRDEAGEAYSDWEH